MRKYLEGRTPETSTPRLTVRFIYHLHYTNKTNMYNYINTTLYQQLSNHTGKYNNTCTLPSQIYTYICVLSVFNNFFLSSSLKLFIIFAFLMFFNNIEFHFIGPVALIVFRAKVVLNEESHSLQKKDVFFLISALKHV